MKLLLWLICIFNAISVITATTSSNSLELSSKKAAIELLQCLQHPGNYGDNLSRVWGSVVQSSNRKSILEQLRIESDEFAKIVALLDSKDELQREHLLQVMVGCSSLSSVSARQIAKRSRSWKFISEFFEDGACMKTRIGKKKNTVHLFFFDCYLSEFKSGNFFLAHFGKQFIFLSFSVCLSITPMSPIGISNSCIVLHYQLMMNLLPYTSKYRMAAVLHTRERDSQTRAVFDSGKTNNLCRYGFVCFTSDCPGNKKTLEILYGSSA